MNKRYLPALLILAIVSTSIEIDMSVPSFPDMARTFGVAEGIIQRTITYNFLGFCLGALLYGPLSECFGRRKMMLIGNCVMLVGALGCVYSQSIDQLLLSRFVQGIGASTSVVLVFAIIADCYQGHEAFKILGLTNAMMSTFMALAPSAGGYVNMMLGWRGNYGVVAAITATALVLMFLLLPETKQKLETLDAGKIVRDYAVLVRHGGFISASLVPSLLFAAYMVFIASSGFLYLQSFGLPIRAFVPHLSIIVLSFAIPSMFAGKLIALLRGPDNTVKVGMGITTGSILLLLCLPENPYVLTALISLYCVGFAICYPIIFGRSMEIFPEMRGTASSVIMSVRSLLVSLLTAAASAFFTGKVFTVAAFMMVGVVVASVLALKPARPASKTRLAD
ncbi:MFS transporter [Cystobacter fuscus]